MNFENRRQDTFRFPILFDSENGVGLGRLVSFTHVGLFVSGIWAQRDNGTRSWRGEGFDSQYVPETLSRGPDALDLWPGTEARMTGDEYVVADGLRCAFASFEIL